MFVFQGIQPASSSGSTPSTLRSSGLASEAMATLTHEQSLQLIRPLIEPHLQDGSAPQDEVVLISKLLMIPIDMTAFEDRRNAQIEARVAAAADLGYNGLPLRTVISQILGNMKAGLGFNEVGHYSLEVYVMNCGAMLNWFAAKFNLTRARGHVGAEDDFLTPVRELTRLLVEDMKGRGKGSVAADNATLFSNFVALGIAEVKGKGKGK